MAKRKNPLKDLDAFLKQEAKNFVEPDPVNVEIETHQETKEKVTASTSLLTEENIIQYLSSLKQSDNHSFYEVLKRAIERAGLEPAENKMLINTVLYLQNKNDWKETIRDYWS